MLCVASWRARIQRHLPGPPVCARAGARRVAAAAAARQVYDAGASFTSPGTPTNAAWLFKTPDGLRNTLVWLHKRYNGPEFWITENGVSGPDEETRPLPGVLDDTFRQGFYQGYLDNLCLAKSVDGVNVKNYYAWSLMDNFEWRDGFSKRFGMVYVDLKTLNRYPKGTALWLSKHFFTSGLPQAVASTATAPAAAGTKAALAASHKGIQLPFPLNLLGTIKLGGHL